MEIRISDLLDSIHDDTIPLRTVEIASSEKIKEAVMRKINERRAGTRKARPVKRVFLLAAALALAALLGTAALAMSGSWGILDFLRARGNAPELLPGAGEAVQTDLPQTAEPTDYASFCVREAAYDGQTLHLVVDVKPVSADYLLLGPDAYPEDPASGMGPAFGELSGSIADYAEASGQTLIQTNVRVDGMNGAGLAWLSQPDGTLTYMLSGSLADDSDRRTLAMTCVVAPFAQQDGRAVITRENIRRSSLDISLENTGLLQSVSSTQAADYASCGVRVDKISLRASEFAVYAEIRYTVTDETKFAATDTGLQFEFLDSDGNILPGGVAAGGGISTEDGVRYVQETSIAAMETLPGEITLRGYNIWSDSRYETHIFEMK